MKAKNKNQKRQIRHKRIRSRVFGTAEKPRLCVFKSNIHTYAQLIDDGKNKVLASASDKEIKTGKNPQEKAFEIGKLIAEKAKGKKIAKAVFDRGGYAYHGKVKALAEGARQGGIEF
jgi:large subunit ribosomal protein L18